MINKQHTRNLTVKQIAKKLNTTTLWIRSLARRNIIPATKKGHYWYFNAEEVFRAYYKDNSFRS
tara:strand:+ start:419 stop:610 length:192 start_codon:yes stop_codon:yes gene_type:complete